MRNGLAVLHIEDSANDSELIARCLKRSNYELVFEQVETAVQMQEALTRREWDIIISDYHLPQLLTEPTDSMESQADRKSVV